MQGEKLLKKYIGRKLEAGIVQSFYFKGKLINMINVTYLKFGDWLKVVSDDEITSFEIENNNIEKLEFFGDDEAKYKLEQIEIPYPEFSKYLGKRFIKFRELVLYKNELLSFGVNLYFENNMNLIIHNKGNSIDDNEYLFENLIPIDLIEK